MLGAAATLVSAEQVVGTLIGKSLAGGPGSVASLYAAGGAPLAATITSLDVFVVQANTNTLAAHFLSLAASLGLLARSARW